MSQPLRKCRKCGLEAHTQKDLELFSKELEGKHGRRNRCKTCHNKYHKQWRELNPLAQRYCHMMDRCYNPNNKNFHNYGGRGITVCNDWHDRQAFTAWANASGFKPELTLERIDNEGHYFPDNCTWVTRSQQNRNQRTNTTNWEKETRICRMCKIEKPLIEFHKNKSMPLGHAYDCKDCRKKYWELKKRQATR